MQYYESGSLITRRVEKYWEVNKVSKEILYKDKSEMHWYRK